MKNFVVVGGGTAGWITALYTKTVYPEDNVTVIESSDIGILGAGEGSTPVLISFLDYVGIPVDFLIQETGATIKNGIKFTNWSNNNNYYYHGFYVTDDNLSHKYINNQISFFYYQGPSIYNFYDNLKDNNLIDKTSEKNKVPFYFNNSLNLFDNKIFDFNQSSSFSIHFDARKLADTLAKIAIERGINRIDSKVIDFVFENSDIKEIILENKTNVLSDFIFDCSGFSKLIIGKIYKSEWKSYQESLPMKKAIPFFIDIDKKNIPPYTESIAMNYGWMWKIPLQYRYGCGYVFDSDFISEEEAKIEIENFLGYVPEYPRLTKGAFSFSPGSFKEIWINNCLAIGLSSSFIEPLEATSIAQSINTLVRFFSKKQHIFNRDKKYLDYFNKQCLNDFQQIVDFIYFHYMTNKTNNIFWKNFTINNKMPNTLEEKLYFLNNSVLDEKTSEPIFSPQSYYDVGKGIGFLNENNLKKISEEYKLYLYDPVHNQQIKTQNKIISCFIDHSEFLKYLGGLKELDK